MPILVLILGAVLVVSLAVFNVNPVAFSIFGATVYVPEGVLLGSGFLFGVLLTLPLYWAKVKAEQASAKALTKWDAEDQKLLTQVQSDKEKQLEAKIATLEAALQRALKK
jgi:uncharacterized integral membrane protein